ncbi:hypothetical protein F4780DRAFT_720668 [Xylariomycetidae sp. FL0641]|nr:hypothetical protein F4780DRAFT_720668 [Xylariomycetidae sp. FL0641]
MVIVIAGGRILEVALLFCLTRTDADPTSLALLFRMPRLGLPYGGRVTHRLAFWTSHHQTVITSLTLVHLGKSTYLV